MPCASKVLISICYLPFFLGHALKLTVLEQANRKESLDVWVLSYPRSGSSTLLSLVKNAVPEGSVFALFEPGDHRDQMDLERRKDGVFSMGEVVTKLSSCNFTGVRSLYNWDDVHTSNNGKIYSAGTAEELCNNATLRVIKTVGDVVDVDDDNRRIEKLTSVLDRMPKMKLLNLVRDPRAVLASWKSLKDFEGALSTRGVPLWREMCDTYAANSKVEDPRVFNVVYEKLVRQPQSYMKTIYKFLGLAFGEEQEKWLQATFPPTDKYCEENFEGDKGSFHPRYADCHGQEESAKEMAAWKDVLSAQEKDQFSKYAPCEEAVKAFDFDGLFEFFSGNKSMV